MVITFSFKVDKYFVTETYFTLININIEKTFNIMIESRLSYSIVKIALET